MNSVQRYIKATTEWYAANMKCSQITARTSDSVKAFRHNRRKKAEAERVCAALHIADEAARAGAIISGIYTPGGE